MSTEKGAFVAHYSPGEVIFREGQHSKSFYVIKSGQIDISITRKGKNIILQTLQAGSTFGETAALLDKPRNATAIARSYTEAYTFTKDHLDKVMKKVPMVVRKLLQAQMHRVADANQRAKSLSSTVNPLKVATEIIRIQAKAARAESNKKGAIILPYMAVTKSMSRVMGLSPYEADQVLDKMHQKFLIKIKGKTSSREILVNYSEMLDKADALPNEVGYKTTGHYEAEDEFMDLDTLISLTGARKKNILRKLVKGDFPEKVLLFRRSEVIDLLSEHGKDFF